MALTKKVNGISVDLTPEEEETLLAERAARLAAKQLFRDQFGYIKKREKAYPKLEDQLDAILKQFNLMRWNGDNMVSDMDLILGQWLQVKQDFPKPPEK